MEQDLSSKNFNEFVELVNQTDSLNSLEKAYIVDYSKAKYNMMQNMKGIADKVEFLAGGDKIQTEEEKQAKEDQFKVKTFFNDALAEYREKEKERLEKVRINQIVKTAIEGTKITFKHIKGSRYNSYTSSLQIKGSTVDFDSLGISGLVVKIGYGNQKLGKELIKDDYTFNASMETYHKSGELVGVTIGDNNTVVEVVDVEDSIVYKKGLFE
ncbi:hypothetical protein [Flammeovirga yaeyamensis]|uniref:hypothetical protein n=1 Tax=Flammeovirga yaeyamensis TaxID=367791 RepID=UPI001615EFB7|nr:hypothetical protein [Flammeovirga yaeyamensis]